MPTWSSTILIIAGRSLRPTQHTNNDYNGFEGFAIEGRPSVVTVRGKVQVRDGAFVGEPERGRMLRRGTQYFGGRRVMPVDSQAAIELLKELRALTADENGAQRLAWSAEVA